MSTEDGSEPMLPFLVNDAPSSRQSKLRLGCGIAMVVVFGVLLFFAVVISVISPILWNTYNHAIAQNALNAAVVTTGSTLILDPTPSGFTIISNITFSGTGSIAATIAAANFSVYYLDQFFAYLSCPASSVEGNNAETTIQQKSVITVIDYDVFRAQCSAVMNGGSVIWRVIGPVEVTVKQQISIKLSLNLVKDITITGQAIQNALAYNITIINGTKTTLFTRLDQHYYNPSNIAVGNLGDAVFASYAPDGEFLGETTIPNFNVSVGDNYGYGLVVSTQKTGTNQKAIDAFMSNFALGVNQTIIMIGPTKLSSGANFMLNVSRMSVTVMGSPFPNPVINSTFGNAEPPYSFAIPTQCLYNPTNVNVTVTNVLFRVIQNIATEDQRYWVGFDTGFSDQPFSCPTGDDSGYFSIGNGLDSTQTLLPYSIMCDIPVAPLSTRQACQGLLPLATCCGFVLGLWEEEFGKTTTFNVSAYGSMDVLVGEFTFHQYFEQNPISVYCDPNSNNTDYHAYWYYFCETGTQESARDMCIRPSPGVFCHQPYFPASKSVPPSDSETSTVTASPSTSPSISSSPESLSSSPSSSISSTPSTTLPSPSNSESFSASPSLA